MDNLWNEAEAGKTDIEQLVYLSRLIGRDILLVQPGGGNTSVKLREEDVFGRPVEALVVKGSGSDLRTIDTCGFTHLYRERLALAFGPERGDISDEEMMQLTRACMTFPDRDPLPSVETPLHSLLPQRFIAHTHDVASLSLTDTPSAQRHVERAFGKKVAFLPYVRPGFPLAKEMARRPPTGALALVMEKHGLAVWAETARECYERLVAVVSRAEDYVAEHGDGSKRVFGPPARPALNITRRRAIAAALLPVIRGELARSDWRATLTLDDSQETLEMISGETFPNVASRGVMTPEHILRAGVRPLILSLDLEQPLSAIIQQTREAVRSFQDDYRAYARANGHAQTIPDYLKTIVIPGVGIASAGRDRRSALIAGDCYRATMRAIAGAEAVEQFQFLSDADACEIEYWPLERRKTESAAGRVGELEGKVAVVIGGASGIGRATALRFAAEGAHVLVADSEHAAAKEVSDRINKTAPERGHATRMDVTDPNAVESALREAVMRFGGIDVLFYSPGIAPELSPVADMPEVEVERQMQVHFRGAVAATRTAARVMLQQGSGGRLVYNASKAAFAPGEGAAAYGAAKAALVHYVRNVALELGRHGITANYINADAVDTPLFRSLLEQRAQREDRSPEEMLQRYAERSVLRTAIVPPEAVAEAALWLASDRSAYTTGCVITIGGGHEAFPR
jgi:rhamnulose-1-phosphate aldolase/alcohol dehydrogenase